MSLLVYIKRLFVAMRSYTTSHRKEKRIFYRHYVSPFDAVSPPQNLFAFANPLCASHRKQIHKTIHDKSAQKWQLLDCKAKEPATEVTDCLISKLSWTLHQSWFGFHRRWHPKRFWACWRSSAQADTTHSFFKAVIYLTFTNSANHTGIAIDKYVKQ